MSTDRLNALKASYASAQQEHVFTFYDKLSEPEQTAFLDQLETINPARVNELFTKALVAEEVAQTASADAIEPLPAEVIENVLNEPEKASRYQKLGLQAVAANKVAVLVMAGGQGTRLGSADPKGCYDIGLPSHKSLFQQQAERIKRLEIVAARAAKKPANEVKVRWYVLTSDPTHDATRAFFGWDKDGNKIPGAKINFGLDEDQVVFPKQGVLPCLTNDGKIMLDTPGKVAVAPNGNGGVYAALREPLNKRDHNINVSNALHDMATHGINYLHAFCVDNCLVKVADPIFLGACIERSIECAAKVVPKEQPTEKVGVVARRDGLYAVVEYSEISRKQAEKRDPSGALTYRAGNIANHFYTLEFLNRTNEMEKSMAFHIAHKEIPNIGLTTGERAKSSGMKLEMFVFDVFPFAKDFLVYEVSRTEEFSPLKNAPGSPADTPQTSRSALLGQQRRFLEAAGAKFADGVEVELSPLVTYAGEDLESVKGKTFTKSGNAETLEELLALAS